MKRLFTEYLHSWKIKNNRKPLIIRGARQVGKTYTVEEFAKNNYAEYVKINFEETPELKELFKTNDVINIKQNLEIYSGKRIIANKTLLFLDEIQSCPEAIVTLRYFYEKMPKLHIITAGSLLDFTLNEMKYSMPVGRVEFAYMYPMNFYEFLWALKEYLLLEFLKHYSLGKEISLPIHQKLLRILRLYYFIGGMPEAVKVYVKNDNLPDVEIVHESIIKSLEFDFAKYGTKSQQEILVKLLRYIPKSIGKKFKYVNAAPELRSESVKKALQLLKMSRIVNLALNAKSAGLPLESNVNEKSYKPLFIDIGLANHILKLRLINIENLITINEGNLAEQFIGQQLLSFAPYYIDNQLYYWAREKRNASAEIDFVTELNYTILPVEVKAGKTGTLKSLHIYMTEKKLKVALRFNTDTPSIGLVNNSVKVGKVVKNVEFNLISLPLYLVLEYKRIIEDQNND